MRRVLLVCSVHRNTGHATAGELHWLLGRLRPDVIFLEHSADRHPAFLDGSWPTLESEAVRRYCDHQQTVELVPVDVDLPVTELKQKFDDLLDRMYEANARLCQLSLWNSQQTEKGGFAYLNSPDSALLQSEMQKEMRAAVEAARDPALSELFMHWTRTHDQRELAMLSAVEAFARQDSFTKAVLLVGAAHGHTLRELFDSQRAAQINFPNATGRQ